MGRASGSMAALGGRDGSPHLCHDPAYSLLLSQWRREHRAPVRWQLYYEAASNLAAAIRELTILSDGERMRCAPLLRGITRNFVELFGPVAGDITIATRIEPLQLAAFKRRALGLMVIELLSNALLYAFRELEAGHIEVQLAQVSRSRALLIVTNNGRGQAVPIPKRCQQIGHNLANPTGSRNRPWNAGVRWYYGTDRAPR